MKKFSRKAAHEEGGAFVLTIALCCVAVLVAFGVARLGSATRLAARAQNAADAAALSAAYEIAHSNSGSACNAAQIAALKNDAKVTSCKVSENDVVVWVHILKNSDYSAQARAEID